MTTPNKLLSCPFCGWEDTAVNGNDWFVTCEHCGAKGPDALAPEDSGKSLWNTRLGQRNKESK